MHLCSKAAILRRRRDRLTVTIHTRVDDHEELIVFGSNLPDKYDEHANSRKIVSVSGIRRLGIVSLRVPCLGSDYPTSWTH